MRRIPPLPFALALPVMALLAYWGWESSNRAGSVAGEEPSVPRVAGSVPAATEALAEGFATFEGKTTPDDARRTLEELRGTLTALPKDKAIARIRAFLESGDDRTTGLSFEIGKDGGLLEWPSFRTFLLDTLLVVDPAAAAATGRDILDRPTSADEWALALRNVARGNPSVDSGYLIAKTEELINNPAWQAKPSIGYLNAFDVLVHAGATTSTPLLSGLIQRKDRKDLAHAGFLTLDRLVQSQPVDVLTRLSADASLQQSRPEMVSQQFARADLRDPAQQALVKTWLLDPARTDLELRSFAGVYPNNNRFISNNLLTIEAGTPGDDLATHDREALKVIVAWAADPSFTPVKEHLGSMISRLDGFVGSRDSTLSSPPPE